MPKLSIVIPAYNEAATIHHILNKVKDVSLIGEFEKEVVIVDDCSKDGTFDRIKEYLNLEVQNGFLGISPNVVIFIELPMAFATI